MTFAEELEAREARRCKEEHDHGAFDCLPPAWWRPKWRLDELSRDFRAREAAPEMLALLRHLAGGPLRIRELQDDAIALLKRIDKPTGA